MLRSVSQPGSFIKAKSRSTAFRRVSSKSFSNVRMSRRRMRIGVQRGCSYCRTQSANMRQNTLLPASWSTLNEHHAIAFLDIIQQSFAHCSSSTRFFVSLSTSPSSWHELRLQRHVDILKVMKFSAKTFSSGRV